jgi:murein DD-endopeptidase MepM/ murein hydrolase activator NlpD
MRFARTRVAALISVMSVVMTISVSSAAQQAHHEVEDLHLQLESARDEISAIQGRAESVQDQIASIDDQMAAVERALDVSSELMIRTQADLVVVHNRIAAMKRRYELVRAQAREIAVDLYKSGPNVELGVLLGAESVAELDSMMAYSSAASQSKIRIMVASHRLKAELESAKTDLDAKLAAAREARNAQLAQRQHLSELRSAQTTKLGALRRRIAAMRAEADALAARSQEIEQQLASLSPAAGSPADAAASPAGAGIGGFAWPIRGALMSGYGERWGRMHEGIDIDCVTGALIRASKEGTVVSATYDQGYGYHVVIDHGGGFASLYAHNSDLKVSSGQSVSQGEVISACGATGESTGDHLHFEIRVNGTAQDPLGYLP